MSKNSEVLCLFRHCNEEFTIRRLSLRCSRIYIERALVHCLVSACTDRIQAVSRAQARKLNITLLIKILLINAFYFNF